MFGKNLENLKKKGALIHNITNYVTVNDVANVLLACGASPIMADEPSDAVEITEICQGLNINIGTLNSRTIETMYLTAEKASQLKHILVLDPVGVGASNLRTTTVLNLIRKVNFDVIKGNISEIKVLVNGGRNVHGVDAGFEDRVTYKNLNKHLEFLKNYAKEVGSIVVVTGEIDIVCDDKKAFVITNGRSEMGKVTGTGCQLSAMITAFLVANSENKLEATAAAVATMGVAGEIGWKNMQVGDGNSTYQNRIIDAIFNMSGEDLDLGVKYEIR